MKMPGTAAGAQQATAAAAAVETGEINKKSINGELWQACAGPLVNLPAPGTHVVYFPQGHSEQVAASIKKDVDAQIPNYTNLPPKLLCLLHNVTLHADPETDEVYAQMTLQPVPSFDKDALLRSDLTMKAHKPQTEFFCKTLTASDTSTHGGFSVPRRAAEKIFPPLDFTMQPPVQELVARDLHDNVWTFRHVYRGQPKRHLLTTGWSLFVNGKRLFAGDSILFIRDEKQQLLLGIRRANRQPPNLSSSVLSSDSMHIGILAAAAHAAANNSPFTVFYNPRASPSEFVIPLAKYYNAVFSNQISLGMRFRMMFETEESGTRRYMGTVTAISDLDPVRWKNSQWRNLQVGWDESTAGEKRSRVSIWEIEPVTAPFFICPSPPFFRSKRPWQPGNLDDDPADLDNLFRRTMPWLGDDFGLKDPQALPGLPLVQWMNMQQRQNPASLLPNTIRPPSYINSNPLSNSLLQNLAGATDMPRQLGLPPTVPQIPPQNNNLQFNNAQRPTMQPFQPQLDQFHKSPSNNPLASIIQQPQAQQQLPDVSQPQRQTLVSQTLPTSQVQSSPGGPSQAQNILQQQLSLSDHPLQINLSQNLSQQQQQQILGQAQLQNLMPSQSLDHSNQNLHMSDSLIQIQLLQKLHQQQQSLLAQQPAMQQPSQLLHNQQKQQPLLDIPPNFSRSMSMSTSQAPDSSQVTRNILPPAHVAQQMTRNNSDWFSQQSKVSELPGQVGHTLNHQLSVGGGHSAVTDDVPSCSTSPSTNNCPSVVQSMVNSGNHDIAHSSAAMINSSDFETLSSSGNLVKDLQQRADIKPSVKISKAQSQGFFTSQPYFNAANGTHIDYLDSLSSATSVHSQNDVQIPPPNNAMSFNSTQPVLFRGANHDGDPRNHVPFASNIDNQLDMTVMPDPLMTKNMVGPVKDYPTTSGGGMLSSYENPKDAQPELSSSMVSQSFGVPDMTFDSVVNDGSFMNRGAWAQPQIPRMRTYTKVYKRGAVGRSVDVMRYSGYDELKQDLARRFGIEGQLEDQQRIGWKLVYMDHENDVLLVGDDPWEEFVNCVRCIKILSPQEVQQMSLAGDFGNNILQNQACSSSDNGVN